MKGKMLGFIALIGLMLIPVVLCCGVAFADDGAGSGSSDWTALWIAIGAVAITLLNLYWDCLKPRLLAILSNKEDDFWYKARGVFLAVFVYALWDMLKAAYKKGLLDAIISILIGIIKRKFGLPAAVKATVKQVDKLFPGP